jgi:signal transduction histidine kinase
MSKLIRICFVFFLVFNSFPFVVGQKHTEKVLKVGVYNNPPKIFINKSNQADGIFIDVLKVIAKNENYKIQYIYGDWYELLEKLKNGTIDIVPDVAYSEERDSLFAFHKLYLLNSWLELFTLKERKINKITEINHLTIGVLKGSIQEKYIIESLKSDFNIDYKYLVYNDYQKTIDALKNREVDVIIANRFMYYSSKFDENILPTGIILKPSDLFFAFRKNINPDIINQFDKEIATMKNNSKSVFYKSIHKWLDKEYKTAFPRFLFWLFGIIILIVFIIAIFNLTLRKKVKEKMQELKLMNQELLFSKIKAEESDQLKTAFLENISHEIRTPLNVICGFSNLLNENDLIAENIKEYTTIIQNSSDQLLHILTDIITLASIETNQETIKYSRFNLYSLMDEIRNIFQKEANKKQVGLKFSTTMTEKKSEIIGDRSKILQIIHHLIHNAIKFTDKGEVSFGYKMKNNHIEFYVTDTGIGITEEQQEKIFDRFTQANSLVQVNYGGTGLGLPISKGLVQILGGKIWVESKIGIGSTFYFTIPVI